MKQGLLRAMMFMATLILIFAFLGCGKKGDPIPPKEPQTKAFSHQTAEMDRK